ncbi:MAG: DUF433 domain-containing protein [Chloroflexi bacterium]|nr:DUF433 domain-containing protein [Chloroflexota bacterium]
MQLEDYFNFLGPDGRAPCSSDFIRIKGHRLGIEHVLSYYRAGYNPDEIAREFPGLSLEKIYATITYYLSHRAAVNAYLARLREQDEQAYQEWAAAKPSPVVRRLRALRAQQAGRKPFHEGALSPG